MGIDMLVAETTAVELYERWVCSPAHAFAFIREFGTLIEVWWLPPDRALVSMEWSYVYGILARRLPSGRPQILGGFVVGGGQPRGVCSSRYADLADPNWC